MWTKSGKVESHSGGVLLLTGATGFVGKRLLAELLEQCSGTVVCLVRAANELEAQRRGRAISKDLRVVFVAADLEQPKLGLTDTAWELLASRVSEIYHCAASVSFDLPLEESRRINVAGTETLLRLAETAATHGKFRRFHHVSTAYVAGKKRGWVSSDYLPDYTNADHFRNPYEQSKAEAEALLRAQTQVPVSIYRPSIVAGDSSNGATDNYNVLYAPMKLIRRGALPFIPAGKKNVVDCIGVDYVVRGIVALGKTSFGRCDSFHLTAGENSFCVAELVQVANEEAHRVHQMPLDNCRVISRLQWGALRLRANLAALAPTRFKSVRRWGKLVSRGVRGFSPYDPYTNVRTQFECAAEKALLAEAKITQPPARDYLRTIAHYAMVSDFGSGTARARMITADDVPEDIACELGASSSSHAVAAGLPV